jgi:hypothetical protein
VLRVRPKAMTVAVIIAGLLPILWGTGAGSEVMSRIAAPMIGGMITAPLLSLFIIPAAYKLIWLYRPQTQPIRCAVDARRPDKRHQAIMEHIAGWRRKRLIRPTRPEPISGE